MPHPPSTREDGVPVRKNPLVANKQIPTTGNFEYDHFPNLKADGGLWKTGYWRRCRDCKGEIDEWLWRIHPSILSPLTRLTYNSDNEIVLDKVEQLMCIKVN